jgi:hypothetical protein
MQSQIDATFLDFPSRPYAAPLVLFQGAAFEFSILLPANLMILILTPIALDISVVVYPSKLI